MTVGARGRFSRRGPGDDRVRILSGPEEDEEPAGVAAGPPRDPQRDPERDAELAGAGGRTVRFALLPDAYQPLRPPAPAGKRPYSKRLKKYGKVRAAGGAWGPGKGKSKPKKREVLPSPGRRLLGVVAAFLRGRAAGGPAASAPQAVVRKGLIRRACFDY